MTPRSGSLLLLAACTFGHAAWAAHDSGRVHRCVGVRGEIVFADAPCDSQALSGISAGAIAPAPDAPPPASEACPTSTEALRQRVARAVARKDANAIAGMLQWRGYDAGSANALLRQIAALVREPLLEIEVTDGLRVRTGSNAAGGVRELEFGLQNSAGCWWLTW